MVVFAVLRPANPLPASQAQGYPPPATSTPTPASLSGYPGPPTAIPTSPAISFTINHTHYFPLHARYDVLTKKGMVWNYYGLTNMDPWNIMDIGWFYRYGPSAAGGHGQLTHIPFWPCHTLTVDLEYTVNVFETRTYVNRYAYWVDWRPTPTPTPIGTPASTATPGTSDNDSENDTLFAPMAYCVEPSSNTIALFTGDSYDVLTQAGEIYRYLGR